MKAQLPGSGAEQRWLSQLIDTATLPGSIGDGFCLADEALADYLRAVPEGSRSTFFELLNALGGQVGEQRVADRDEYGPFEAPSYTVRELVFFPSLFALSRQFAINPPLLSWRKPGERKVTRLRGAAAPLAWPFELDPVLYKIRGLWEKRFELRSTKLLAAARKEAREMFARENDFLVGATSWDPAPFIGLPLDSPALDHIEFLYARGSRGRCGARVGIISHVYYSAATERAIVSAAKDVTIDLLSGSWYSPATVAVVFRPQQRKRQSKKTAAAA